MKDIISLFKNSKYKRVISSSFVFSLFFAAAAFFELNTSYRLELKRAETQSSNLSQVLEEQLSGTFKKLDLTMLDAVRTIQEKKYFNKSDSEKVKSILIERFKDIPEAKTFYAVDKNGYDIFRKKEGKSVYLGDRDYFTVQKASMKDELYISRPLFGRMTGMRSIALSRRLVNKKNEFVGIVAAVIPLTYFRDLYSKLDIGKEGSITLCSNENIMYARYPWSEEFIGKKLANEDIISQIFDRNEKVINGNRLSRIDGITRYSSSRRIADSKFFVVVGISRDEILSAWKQRSLFYTIGFLLSWSIGFFYLVSFLKSMQELDDRKKSAIQTAKLTSLGEMASGIAHEINNPLAVISTRATQMRRQIERGQYDPEAFKASLLRINQTVDRIAKIIRGLKSFSRNAEQDAFDAVQLKSIVENTLELCNEKFRHQRVLLKVDTVPEAVLYCREAQLVQVLLNLLSNAYDAVERLEDRWTHVSFSIDQNEILSIMVTDSGEGIPEKIAQDIMQPFFSTKEVGKGTGLGLSISKGIIEDHKGNFYLDQKSKNTRFVIELPVSIAVSIHSEEPRAS